MGHDHPIIVDRGAVRIDTLRVVGPTSFDHATQRPRGQGEGEFELVFGVYGCRLLSFCGPAGDFVVRKRFTVTRQP
jgi:hypothetical protein